MIPYGAAEKSRLVTLQDFKFATFFCELQFPCMCMCSTESRAGVIYSDNPERGGGKGGRKEDTIART